MGSRQELLRHLPGARRQIAAGAAAWTVRVILLHGEPAAMGVDFHTAYTAYTTRYRALVSIMVSVWENQSVLAFIRRATRRTPRLRARRTWTRLPASASAG